MRDTDAWGVARVLPWTNAMVVSFAINPDDSRILQSSPYLFPNRHTKQKIALAVVAHVRIETGLILYSGYQRSDVPEI